jgi:hypothetical protein
MTRTLVVVLAIGLVLAPAALAKGPHAILTSAPEPVVAGVPWEATVELNEFRTRSEPMLIATRADGHVDAKVRRVPASMRGAQGFKTTMVFPHDGRWRLMLIAGERRFRFPALSVGSDRVPQDYVAFAVGSEAARQGGGGVYMEPEPVDTGGDDGVLPPEVLNIAENAEQNAKGDEEDGLASWWLFPLVGVVLAGAGAGIALRTRG